MYGYGEAHDEPAQRRPQSALGDVGSELGYEEPATKTPQFQDYVHLAVKALPRWKAVDVREGERFH